MKTLVIAFTLAAFSCVLGVWFGLSLAHSQIDREVAYAQKRADAYQAKDAQNYPLARQWREAYEKLAKTCEVKK